MAEVYLQLPASLYACNGVLVIIALDFLCNVATLLLCILDRAFRLCVQGLLSLSVGRTVGQGGVRKNPPPIQALE